MSIKRHWAIFGDGIFMKSNFIQNLLKGKPCEELKVFEGKYGVLFSNYTLEQFILEENKHDDFTLSVKEQRSIRTFSSGEQRKALLSYLLSTKPDFLVLDNVFDMLDIHSINSLTKRMEELSHKISIIQVVKRKDSLLPFITNALEIVDGIIRPIECLKSYLNWHKNNITYTLQESLPPAPSWSDQKSNPLVKFCNVTVKYADRTIVSNINWTIKHGDFWKLKGPNGSGKTTLLTMITGDNPKAYGQYLVLFGKKRGTGESIWDIKKRIGYITPSMITLFRGWNTVEKMVISGLVDSIGLYKKPSDLQKQLAKQWIRLLGLEKQKLSRFSTLNEVQKRMVLIARSMIKHPTLLILDEPAHGLDDYNASILTALVNKIAEEGNTTIIYVSHQQEPGLEPKQVYELMPSDSGSIGKQYKHF